MNCTKHGTNEFTSQAPQPELTIWQHRNVSLMHIGQPLGHKLPQNNKPETKRKIHVKSAIKVFRMYTF